MKKLFSLMVFFLICFVCSGCFQAKTDLIISEDGSVKNSVEIIGVPLLAEQIEELKDSLTKNIATAKVTSITSENMSGYRIEATYPTIEEFANSGMKFYLSQPGKCKGIQEHKGIFFDEYYFDLLVEKNASAKEPSDEMEKALLAQVKFDFTVTLPYATEIQNADNTLNDNKTLYWNLKTTVVGNEDRQIQFRFKIWHKQNCIITLVLLMLLVGATIYFIFQSKKLSEDTKIASAMTKVKIFGVSTIMLIVISAYMILSPVEFTDDDIISKPSTAKEEMLTEQNKEDSLKIEEKSTHVDNTSFVSPSLGEHWIKDDKTDVYLWNPEPNSNEQIAWSGGYVQDGKYKFAEGSGTVTWYRNGQVIQVDEGSFEHGRHHGQFKNTFKSGNVQYSKWNHGEKVADIASESNGAQLSEQYVGTYSSGMKAYIIPSSLKVSADRNSCNVKIIAKGDSGDTTYLDYHIWREGNSLHFSNSEGYSGAVTPDMTVENKIWEIAQTH